MKKIFIPLLIMALILINNSTFSQATVPFTTCPDVNIAVVREGTNADITNPYFIYNVNTATGGMTLLPGGPLLNPADPSIKMQINGVGLNTTDGFLYGLAFEGSVNTARFVRFDKNYGVTALGNIAPPTSPTGPLGFVNSAAGDCDRANNYYFSAFTSNAPAGNVLDKMFLGKISNISTLAGTPTAEYFEIDFSDLPCSNYISTLTSDPSNSGLKDFVFSSVTNTFFTYVTYKPTGAADFSGQLVEIKPIPGSSPLKYKMFCKPVVNTHTAEVAGTLIDNAGNFEILFTDGTMGKMVSSGTPNNYTGAFTVLNAATGLPNPLRGDLAGCGGPSGGPLPVKLTSFDFVQQNCRTAFSWTAETEINVSGYQLQQSFDGSSFSEVSNVSANRNNTKNLYHVELVSPGRQAYYRLKSIDMDGNYSYSKIISVANSCGNETGIFVTPNPAKDIITVSWYGVKTNSVVDVKIYNSVGHIFKKISQPVPQGSSIFNINVSNLLPGVYYIKTVDIKNNTILNTKFVKQ
jgi:hypothetical protein